MQLFQWTWPAIAAECTDVLGPAGFDYVLTSPPREHILGEPWWTAYQPVSYQVESRLGSRVEFAEMVATCDGAGVGIVADAVINHMTGQEGAGTGWVGSTYEHYEYPGIYSDAGADFHHCGLTGSDDIENYQDRAQVQSCELLNLADLATETDGVRERIGAYLADLLSLGVAGFRIDAAKHMPAEDMQAITDALPEGTVVWSEVIRGAGEPIQPEEYVPAGQVFEFGFPTQLDTAMATTTGSQFESLAAGSGLLGSADAVTFVDNHDTERNSTTLSYRADARYALANAFLLAVRTGYRSSTRATRSVRWTAARRGRPRTAQGWSYAECSAEPGPGVTYRIRAGSVSTAGRRSRPWSSSGRRSRVRSSPTGGTRARPWPSGVATGATW